MRLGWGRASALPGARWSRGAALAAAGVLLLTPALARAGAAECVAAHSHGQAERNAGRLQSAKTDFVKCSNAVCPGAIQAECVAFLAELEVYSATVVFAAVDSEGNDAIDVKVKVDDQIVLDKLTGLATTLDPGSHTVTYVWPDGFEQKQNVVVAQGEKNRRVELRREPEKVAAPPPAPPPPPKTEQAAAKGAPAAAYVLGGVGVLALGSFAAFAVMGKSAQSDMDGCKPYCTQAQADKMRLRYLVADISLGVGLVSLGASGYLFVRASREPSGNAMSGASIAWGGTF